MSRNRSSSITRTPRAIAALIVVGGMALAACGGGGSGSGVASASGSGQSASGSSSSSGSTKLTEADALKFTKCMRSNGVSKFPDPTVDSNGNVQLGFRGGGNGGTSGQAPFNPRSQSFRTALTACRKLLPTINFTPQQQTQFRDAALKFAKCMRKHGVDVPDPTFTQGAGPGGGAPAAGGGTGGGTGGGRGGGIFGRNLNRNDPKVKAALTACQSTFANLPRRGFRPGGGGQ